MEDSNLVSIIVPIFNAEEYLYKCIDSILLQTHRDIEVILVNDGSEDNSGSMCEAYAYQDSRIKVTHQNNSGPSEARNKGIYESRGKYLQFVDADDEIDSTMIESLISAYKNDIDLVLCGYKIVERSGKYYKEKDYFPSNYGDYSFSDFMSFFPELFKKTLINSPCNKLYNARIIRENGIFFKKGIHNGEDLLFNIEYLKLSGKVALVNHSLYLYIKSNNSVSLTKKYKKGFYENRKLVFDYISRFINNYAKRNDTQNKSLIYEIYTNYVFQSLSNIFNRDTKSVGGTKKRKELKEIINDPWVKNNINNLVVSTYQERIIKFLLHHQSIMGLSVYFNIKNIIRKYFKVVFKFLKQFNSKSA